MQKYITLDGHTWSEDFITINAAWFNKLPKNYQQIIKTAAYSGQWADRAAEALASRVLDFAAINKSMEVYVPTPAELEQFKTAAQPSYTWLRGEIGNEVVDRFLKTVKEGEKYFGY